MVGSSYAMKNSVPAIGTTGYPITKPPLECYVVEVHSSDELRCSRPGFL